MSVKHWFTRSVAWLGDVPYGQRRGGGKEREGCEATVQFGGIERLWCGVGEAGNVWAAQSCMRDIRDVFGGEEETRTLQVELLRLRNRAN